MDRFTKMRGVAAPLLETNIDTDQLIPKQFLTTTERTGLGRGLFFEQRYNADGTEREDYVLNREPYRQARILIAGENFGCGSSREHAVWALLDFGIRSIIAPSFAAIFQNNAYKNGILPIALPQPDIDGILAVLEAAGDWQLTVDLVQRHVLLPDGSTVSFSIDDGIRTRLLEGIDDIGATLRQSDAVARYAVQSRARLPWLWQQGETDVDHRH